ncbi:alpha/beta hydrolase family protein [Bacteroides helcogenes]|uniref:Abhydrolase family protein n=1 Tax=Bacteroides helcogenes (strain ATCC 35417 / DSM 20613 / JCM 6297 / CCUG 15421 / P 36-108) TaxID=693979 RepID=E6SN75_BACT6|nr:alpha/beta hydrolase family protein [Bacteroides helcogenes]ADV44728.1 hypothetical protein Bache_2785 [Bacteroides helcogenes P 36-108]MDY5238511.1 alpha/beta hydrolase family protein [Bacteroides helcogenes]
MNRFYNTILLLLLGYVTAFAQNDFQPDRYRVVTTDRSDGRFISTYGIVHQMLKDMKPKYAFNPAFTQNDFLGWQKDVSLAMAEIMCHPQSEKPCTFICVGHEQKDGYKEEKWEFYPLPSCVSTFYVLIPDNVRQSSPAVLCIPGSGMTKEHLIGRISSQNMRAAMALNVAKQGYIAVAVDNAAAGEAADLEHLSQVGYDYDTPSRILLELGWSYLGYTSYLDKQVLDWMKRQSMIRKDRIVVSGFSLGTEPLMVLGALDPDIYGFVYNDFLCQTQERAIVMTAPDENGRRPFPNSIRHLIPNFWRYFNFPDIVASLAPRPLILTEGGLDRDLDLVRRAYEISEHPENVEIHHYAKFQMEEARNKMDKLPEGMDRNSYYISVNVDGVNHYFKNEYVLPWLERLFNK